MRGAAGSPRSTRKSRSVIAAAAKATSATPAAEQTHGIEEPREAFHADGRDQPVRRLEPGDAAERRRPDDRAGGLTAERDRQHGGGDRGGGTRRRAARRMRRVSRIAGAGRHHPGKFGGHRLAEDQAAGAPHHRHRGGIGARPMAGVDGRAILRRQVGGIEDVLDPDRKTAQRRANKPRVFRGTGRRLEVKRYERADLGLVGRDRLGAEFDDSTRGEFAGFDAAGQVERGKHQTPLALDQIDVPSPFPAFLRCGPKAGAGSRATQRVAWLPHP